jgi:hypothetical protein
MRHKKLKPPIFVGGSEKVRAADCPRYMNVPFPAPCHVAVAGVGKQSVWGLRIIACSSISTVTSFPKFVNTQKAPGKWVSSEPHNRSIQQIPFLISLNAWLIQLLVLRLSVYSV